MQGQDSPEIESLAGRTASQIAKFHPKRVVIGRFSGCLLNTQMCESLELKLRALLGAAVPDIKFSSREDVVPILESRRFISIDSYNDSIVRTVVKNLGVDVLVVENLAWKDAYYELSAKIIDVSNDKELGTYSFKVFRPASDKDESPIFFRDSTDGPFIIILRGDPTHYPPFRNVACDKCPDPKYSKEARDKKLEGTITFMATVSEQGLATQIALVSSVDSALTSIAFQTLQEWRFKPAIGLDGKPVAVRVPIEFTFRFMH